MQYVVVVEKQAAYHVDPAIVTVRDGLYAANDDRLSWWFGQMVNLYARIHSCDAIDRIGSIRSSCANKAHKAAMHRRSHLACCVALCGLCRLMLGDAACWLLMLLADAVAAG